MKQKKKKFKITKSTGDEIHKQWKSSEIGE